MPWKREFSEKECLTYHFSLISLLSKVPVIIPELEMYYDNPVKNLDEIIIHDTYFRDFNCLDFNCFSCCNKMVNIYTINHYSRLKLNNSEYKKIDIEINGKKFGYVIEDHIQSQCVHLSSFGCGIHSDSSLLCFSPLVKIEEKIKEDRRNIIIRKTPIKRRHLIGCPIGEKNFVAVSLNRFYDRCIKPIIKIQEECEYAELENWCSEVINLIHEKYRGKIESESIESIFQ